MDLLFPRPPLLTVTVKPELGSNKLSLVPSMYEMSVKFKQVFYNIIEVSQNLKAIQQYIFEGNYKIFV